MGSLRQSCRTVGLSAAIATLVLLSAAHVAFAQSDTLSSLKVPELTDAEQLLSLIDPANVVAVQDRYAVLEWEGPRPRHLLYESKAFDEVESLLRELSTRPRGDYPATVYWYAIESLAEVRDDVAVESQRAIMDLWCKNSKSHYPWLVRGAFNYEDGFRIRGRGWATEVAKDAWPKFRERIEWSQTDLLQAARLNASDPAVFAMLISVDTAAGSTREVMEGHFEAVRELDPAYYPAWIAKLWYLLPRWHGTEESLREFLGEIEIQIKSHPWLFEVMLNYLDIVRGEQRDSFEWSDTKIYEPIKEAFGRRISMHPDSVYLKQRFALYAYRAEDWDRAVSLMDEAGDVYANSGWDSLETYNEYRARTYLKYARGKSNAEILRYAKRALELAPDNYWVVYDVAYTTRLITYDFHSSLALARHSIQLNSEYAPTYWLQAVELVNTNQFDAAVESAEKGLEYAKGNEIKRLLNQVLDAARERTAD